MLENNDIQFLCSYSNPMSRSELVEALKTLGDLLPDPLSERVNIAEYAEKLLKFAEIFYAKSENRIIGMVALYANDMQTRIAHIPLVVVANQYQHKGVGKELMLQAIALAKSRDMDSVWLYVHKENGHAIDFYYKLGFQFDVFRDPKIKIKMIF